MSRSQLKCRNKVQQSAVTGRWPCPIHCDEEKTSVPPVGALHTSNPTSHSVLWPACGVSQRRWTPASQQRSRLTDLSQERGQQSLGHVGSHRTFSHHEDADIWLARRTQRSVSRFNTGRRFYGYCSTQQRQGGCRKLEAVVRWRWSLRPTPSATERDTGRCYIHKATYYVGVISICSPRTVISWTKRVCDMWIINIQTSPVAIIPHLKLHSVIDFIHNVVNV